MTRTLEGTGTLDGASVGLACAVRASGTTRVDCDESESDGDAAPGAPHRPSEVASESSAHASPKSRTSLSGGTGHPPASAGPNSSPLGPRADVPRSRLRKTCLSRSTTRPRLLVSPATTPPMRREVTILA